MSLLLLDDTLHVNVFYEKNDNQFCDNICIRFWESCPDEEKLFKAGETNIFITHQEARQLADLLLKAANASLTDCDQQSD
jgi:hypothetical protein